jgi:hypothetical protein
MVISKHDLQVLCPQNDGQIAAEPMEDQPSRKKQRISNPNSKFLNATLQI